MAAPSIMVGIDPGANTGYALWDFAQRKLLAVQSCKIHWAMDCIKAMHRDGTLHLVVWEDARLRSWFGEKGREALQGAGSIKRDASIWADFLSDIGCPHLAIKPQAGATKWSADYFKRVTGWAARTNEHGRDAAVLVYGRKPIRESA